MFASLKAQSVKTGRIKSRSGLVGNPAYTPPGFESIATVTSTGSQSTFTFSNIPQGFASLQIRGVVAATVNYSQTYFQMNSNATDVYTFHATYGAGDGNSVSSYGAGTTGTWQGMRIGGNGTSQLYGSYHAFIIDIHDYASTTRNKTVRQFSGVDSIGDMSQEINLASGMFVSTSAITSLTFYITGASFRSGTQFALYGIRGGS